MRVLLWIVAGVAALGALLLLPLPWPDEWVGSRDSAKALVNVKRVLEAAR